MVIITNSGLVDVKKGFTSKKIKAIFVRENLKNKHRYENKADSPSNYFFQFFHI